MDFLSRYSKHNVIIVMRIKCKDATKVLSPALGKQGSTNISCHLKLFSSLIWGVAYSVSGQLNSLDKTSILPVFFFNMTLKRKRLIIRQEEI